MRHYEICFIVHPDQSEQVPAMIERIQQCAEAGLPAGALNVDLLRGPAGQDGVAFGTVFALEAAMFIVAALAVFVIFNPGWN